MFYHDDSEEPNKTRNCFLSLALHGSPQSGRKGSGGGLALTQIPSSRLADIFLAYINTAVNYSLFPFGLCTKNQTDCWKQSRHQSSHFLPCTATPKRIFTLSCNRVFSPSDNEGTAPRGRTREDCRSLGPQPCLEATAMRSEGGSE